MVALLMVAAAAAATPLPHIVHLMSDE